MKHSFVFSILLVLTIFTSGCAAILGEEEHEPRERLNIADWPTPIPETVPATPTPFPKTTLSPTSTPIAQAAVEETAPQSAVTSLDLTGNPLELVQKISEFTGGLAPFGAASVTVDDLSIRQGPDESFEELGTLNQGELAAALGKNEAGDWLYVITASLVQGWIPVDAVRLTGSLASASVLPDDQLDSATTQTAATAPPAVNIAGDAAQARLSFLRELAPVAAAFAISDGVTIHQRPSASSGVVGTLEQGELAGILGKDPSNDWVFVITLSLIQGWMPVDSLRAVGALEEAPVLPPDPVAAALARAGLSAPTSAGSAASSVQTIDIDTLTPIATARVNNAALNLRQRPGASYKLLDTLSQGDEVTVFALNRDREWALLEAANQQLGWGSIDFLEIDDSLANAPQVQTLIPGEDHPEDEIAPIIALTASSGGVVAAVSSSPANDSTTPGTPDSLATTDGTVSLPNNTLAPVTTGEIIEKVDLRRGPGTVYAGILPLTVDELVSIRGANEAKDWVVIEATNSRVGWIPVDSLNVESSLENVPQVLTAWVESNGLEVNRGPGIYFETIGTLAINDLVSVLALSEGRNWALVETLSAGQGWIPLRFLDVNGSLANTPQVAAPPLVDGSTDDPTFPRPSETPSGKLVVQTSSGGDIMLINADGTGLRRLTNGIDPVLSADGQQVAFTRWQGDIGTLWVINVDGTDERPLLGDMRKAKGPEWSPDGSQIVLNFQHGGRVEDKRDCNTLTGGSFPGIPRNATNVEVNRGGEGNFILCFTLPPDAQWSLRVIDVADGSFDDLYGGLYAFRPAWDPNQAWRIVSDSGSGLLAVDINREEFRQPLTDEIGDGSPVFSPDGRFLALSTNVQGGHDIFRMNADGSGRVRLTETPLWVPIQPDSDGNQWNNVAPVWSPDGSQIAFLTDRTDQWEIWIMNADGSNQHPLFSEEINSQLNINYEFVDERVLSWR